MCIILLYTQYIDAFIMLIVATGKHYHNIIMIKKIKSFSVNSNQYLQKKKKLKITLFLLIFDISLLHIYRYHFI